MCKAVCKLYIQRMNTCTDQSLLKGPCLEGGAHLEGVEALLVEQVELLQAPAHQLHGEASGIDWGVGVQGWNDLHQH